MALSSLMTYQDSVKAYHPATFIPDVPLSTSQAPIITVLKSEATDQAAIQSGEESGAIDQAPGFGEMVKGYLKDVNDHLESSDEKTNELMTGKTHDTGAVVTSIEEADLALQFALAIRTKMVTAYQAINAIQF